MRQILIDPDFVKEHGIVNVNMPSLLDENYVPGNYKQVELMVDATFEEKVEAFKLAIEVSKFGPPVLPLITPAYLWEDAKEILNLLHSSRASK